MATADQIYEALLASMQDMSTIIPNFRCILFGDSGVGKTVMAMQIAQAITPPDKKIAYIDFREGWVVLLNPEWRSLQERVVRFQYQGLSQLENMAYAIKAAKPPFGDFGAVILDEGTSMSQDDLQTVIKKNVEREPTKDPDVAAWPDYNAEQNRFTKTFNILNSAPTHFLMLCHERTDKRNGLEYTDLAFQPGLSKIVKRDMHLVGHMFADQQQASGLADARYLRQIQVHPTRFVSAKTRISGLPVKFEINKLVPAITEYLRGDRGDEEPKEIINEIESTPVNANSEPSEFPGIEVS